MWKKGLKFLLSLGITILVFVLLFIGCVYIGIFGKIPSKNELNDIKQAQASVVYSADGEIIGKYFYTNRTNIPYHQLPKHLINALVATEDSRFYEHKGIDKVAMLRVLVKTIILRDNSAGGGSTLSQQLAKNLFKRKDYSFLSMPVNKTKEAILANRLEALYSKQDILALYFNTVPFGEQVYGIESASQRYFSKHCSALSLEQSAILVGMLKANSYYNPKKHPDHAFKRRNVVLKQMVKAGSLSNKKYQQLSKNPINTQYTNLQRENPNGYFLYQVQKKTQDLLEKHPKDDGSLWNLKSDGLIVETTLVAELQNVALKARKNHLEKIQKSMNSYWKQSRKQPNIQKLIAQEWQQSTTYKQLKKAGKTEAEIATVFKKSKESTVFNWNQNTQTLSPKDAIEHSLKMIHAAVYAIQPTSGAVQVYVGGNNYEHLPYNLIKSERQTASTFKPFVYAAALEIGEKPCDWINNEEKVYTDYNNWKPQNYDRANGGYYSMLGALAKSANIPTVATYFKVGNSNLQKTATALGLQKNLENNPSVALGTIAYSLESIANAYVPFATKKHSTKPYFISSIKTPSGKVIYQHKSSELTPVDITPNTLETMQYLLKNVVDNGTAKRLKTQYHAKGAWAGKTGTSQDYSDSWFVGFNQNLVIGTWVGCTYPSIHLPSSIGGGSVAALPIVGAIVGHNYKTKQLNQLLSGGFPRFSKSVISDCDCEPYREENTFEKIWDVLDKKEKKQKKKGNFFSRLFGKKKKDKEE